MAKISVIINTLNESSNIRNCLRSVHWADEIVIVDMYSDDDTVSIAQEFTNKIFFHERVGYADPARQFALDQASHEWILVVDADEIVPFELANYLKSESASISFDGYMLSRRNFMFGDEILATGWAAATDLNMRFFKKNFMSYSSKIHDFAHMKEGSRIKVVDEKNLSLIHFNYLDYEHFLSKLNRYTSIEAGLKFAGGNKTNSFKVFARFCYEFLKRYIYFRGFKDGVRGVSLSLLMATYKATVEMKLSLMNEFNSPEPIDAIKMKYQRTVDAMKFASREND